MTFNGGFFKGGKYTKPMTFDGRKIKRPGRLFWQIRYLPSYLQKISSFLKKWMLQIWVFKEETISKQICDVFTCMSQTLLSILLFRDFENLNWSWDVGEEFTGWKKEMKKGHRISDQPLYNGLVFTLYIGKCVTCVWCADPSALNSVTASDFNWISKLKQTRFTSFLLF